MCLGPRDCVAQGSENEVRVKEGMFDYFGICFSCLSEKQRHNHAGMWHILSFLILSLELLKDYHCVDMFVLNSNVNCLSSKFMMLKFCKN